MPCLHNFTMLSPTLVWSPVTEAITTQPTGWITVWSSWLFICCWEKSPAEERGRISAENLWTQVTNQTHTHRCKAQSVLSVITMHNTCSAPLPFIQTVAGYSSPYLPLSSFPHPPSIMYYYNHAPHHVLHHLLSLHHVSFAHFLSHPIPSHPSPRLPACPGRLQMVLNGRITERNCFVNNSTGTRWATGQPACVDTREGCTHATHTCMCYRVKLLYLHCVNKHLELTDKNKKKKACEFLQRSLIKNLIRLVSYIN